MSKVIKLDERSDSLVSITCVILKKRPQCWFLSELRHYLEKGREHGDE